MTEGQAGHFGAGEPEITHGEHGMTRRQLIRHAAWFGAAVALTVTGGEVISQVAGDGTPAAAADTGALRFVQVSDSHLGFAGTANPDVAATFGAAINQVNALGYEPDFVMHSGDVTHLSLAAEFGQAKEMMSDLRTPRVFTVPGEHDTINDGGKTYRKFFGAGTLGDGWFSFDVKGVHVISLVNTTIVDALGNLGPVSSTLFGATSPGCPRRRRSWCSATSRCTRCTRSGAGVPATRCNCSACFAASAR
jgi:hypothetical protein